MFLSLVGVNKGNMHPCFTKWYWTPKQSSSLQVWCSEGWSFSLYFALSFMNVVVFRLYCLFDCAWLSRQCYCEHEGLSTHCYLFFNEWWLLCQSHHSTGLPLGSCWCYLYSTVSDLPVLVKTASTRLINTEFLRQICTRVESCCVVMLMTDTNMNERVFLSSSLTSKELSIIPKRAPLPVFNALGLCCQPYEWCKSLLTLIPSVQAVCKQCCYAILPAVEKTRYFTWNLFDDDDTILCSFSSCLLSPSFCHVLLLLMPTIHHEDFSKV